MSADARKTVQTQALLAAQRRLKQAAQFAELHAGPVLWRKTMKLGGGVTGEVRLLWPGTLKLYDSATGELLAAGMPGQPFQLDPTFVLESQG